MAHESVLLKEAIDGLSVSEGDVYLDATSGSGGHLEEVWNRTKGSAVIAGIDADEMSIEITRQRLELLGANPKLAVLNFRSIDKAPEILGIESPTKILFDLGWSSDQFEGDLGLGRGFSFKRDEPLVMTFKSHPEESETTAFDVVNRWSEENLATVIWGYGEEKFSRRIAKAIVERRKSSPIKSSLELAELIKSSVPVFYRFGRIHPATKTFQAIRIAVNDELQALEEGLDKAFELMKKNGILAVISFHSLEDRIVKDFFKSLSESGLGEYLEIGGKKPIIPSEAEVAKNPRSRSAKLRIIKKV